MRILIITQWFDPEPTSKGLVFAKRLMQAGHDVHVITGFPNYPGGEVYSGYRIRWRQREVIDGVAVTRVPLFPSHGTSAFGRALNYLTFAASATVAGLFTRFRPDVAYVYHPPLTVGIAAAVISVVRRFPFVYDVQDLWPDTLGATGMIRSRRLISLIGRCALLVYRRAAIVIAQSRGFAAALEQRGVPASKLRIIYNWCDEGALADGAAPAASWPQLRGKFNVIFAGNIGKAQALTAVVEAADIVRMQNPYVQFVFIGDGSDAEAVRERARSSPNVIFLPRVPMVEIAAILKQADVLLVHLRDEPLFEITIPSKIQAYLYVGRPVLAAVRGEAADLVEEAGAGRRAIPEDPASIADRVLELAALSADETAALGANGRAFYDEKLSLDCGIKRMIHTFEDAISGRRPGRLET